MYLFLCTFLVLYFPISSPLICHCSPECDSPTCTTEGACVGKFVSETNFIFQECVSPNMIVSTCEYEPINRTCCPTDLCNNLTYLHMLYPTTEPTNTSYYSRTTKDEDGTNQPNSLVTLVAPVVVVIFCLSMSSLLFVVIFLPLTICWRSRHRRGTQIQYKSPLCRLDEEISELDNTYGSGSGAGMAQLSQVTIARQVERQKLIGSGRYGEVWQGVWRDQQVAVKISYSQDAPSWESETHIYMTDLIRHENILGFVASDKIDLDFSLQYWLITDYMPHGSLLEYLNERSLSICEALKLAKGAAAGVAHLHTEIKGGHRFDSSEGLYKPCIIHRDLKSKNVLVSATGEAVIGDFGLAVRCTEDSPRYLRDIFDKKEGTKRYLSPELLEDSVEETTVVCEMYKRADVYSLCLVLWEIFRCCLTEGVRDDCELPFYSCVSREPSFQEMREIVLVKGVRPPIPGRWNQSKALSEVSEMIQECWLPGYTSNSSPPRALTTSLPSLLIKKRLVFLYDQVRK